MTTAAAAKTSSSSSYFSSRHNDAGILVICGVDGNVYTILAETGQLIGMFESGEALIRTSANLNGNQDNDGDDEEEEDEDEMLFDSEEEVDIIFDSGEEEESEIFYDISPNHDDDNHHSNSIHHSQQKSENSTPMIVPGLDGMLYQIQTSSKENDDIRLVPLPMSVQDVMDVPISTCDDDNDGEEECGIVMGEKQTQIYALNPLTGMVHWMQRGHDQRRGFTSHAISTAKSSASSSSSSSAPSPRLLLLQRDNYHVRQVDVQSGMEHWNVTVGKFHALDFTMRRKPRRNAYHEAITNGLDEKISPLPSILFSEDGTHLMAVRGSRVLWKRRTGTVIASVFGAASVPSASTSFDSKRQGKNYNAYQWIELDVISDPNMLFENKGDDGSKHSGLLPNSDNSNFNGYEAQLAVVPADVNHERIHRMEDYSLYVSPNYYQMNAQCHPTNHQQHLELDYPFGSSVAQPPLHTNQKKETERQAVGGMFVSHTVLFIVALLFSVALMKLKLLYKQQQQHQRRNVALSASSKLFTTSSSLHEDNSSHINRNNEKSSTAILERSNSMPELRPNPILNNFNHDSNHAITKRQTSANTNSTTANTTQSHATIHGIPLVTYPRYRSEFDEQKCIGSGGFGSVYYTLNKLDQRTYAVKKVVIRGDLNRSRMKLNRVLREVKSLALLDHVNIVRYYTSWLELAEDEEEDEDNDGGSLDEEKECMSESRTSSLLFQRKRSRNNPLLLPSTSIHLSSRQQEEDSVVTANNQQKNNSGHSDTDLGFDWDRNEGSSVKHNQTSWSSPSFCQDDTTTTDTALDSSTISSHVLYIQMQYCTHTLQEFLASPIHRGSRNGIVNIELALNLFHQIVQGVAYVHKRGLIHRDLKPSNCFLLENMSVVKVGDFGLSRSSQQPNSADATASPTVANHDSKLRFSADFTNTAGVGTYLYASPEQIKGNDYDNSTDVFSLGVILFELCYPMYTGMERAEILRQVHSCMFPKDWLEGFAKSYPAIHGLLCRMLDTDPSIRPSAREVGQVLRKVLNIRMDYESSLYT
eukprot:CAMPEP_0116076920 /NCGR_PEP_ID=MMETSP0322-20121206/17554_1 /TAXON_ID=163516 /ORGANISM="Leptocylindrus danicus var. apora, Strain B651" /LENGTH=1037 /DNA_ID=CAMNT_0003567335 /DNA_START=143 /DNA_END=3256 /DNA_ORIENTATION=+